MEWMQSGEFDQWSECKVEGLDNGGIDQWSGCKVEGLDNVVDGQCYVGAMEWVECLHNGVGG